MKIIPLKPHGIEPPRDKIVEQLVQSHFYRPNRGPKPFEPVDPRNPTDDTPRPYLGSGLNI